MTTVQQGSASRKVREGARLALLGMALCFASVCRAEPRVFAHFPLGAVRGASVVVEVTGSDLQGVRVFLPDKGIRVDQVSVRPDGTAAEVRVAVSEDAPLGPHRFWLYSAAGVSREVPFWVDVFPEIAESEPNDDSGSAQLLAHFPVTVNGRIQAPGERDTFGFEARKGETWVFDITALRAGSFLSAAITLQDGQGTPLAAAESRAEQDARLIHTFEATGRYLLTVRDREGAGGPGREYRLTLGVIPVVEEHNPRGERPGRRLGMDIAGPNVTKPRAIVTLPEGAGQQEVWTEVQTPQGPSLPLLLLTGPLPVTGVTETDARMPIPLLPTYLDGAFLRIPRISFFFRAAAGDQFVFDLWGRRIGSRIEGALRILDSAGREVAASAGSSGGDARIDFEAPAAGIYTVEARNGNGDTGPECFYRLEARKTGAGFEVLLPDEIVTLKRGEARKITARVVRQGGFRGAVRISVDSLPPGLRSTGALVPPGASGAELTISAAPGAGAQAHRLRIVGTATIGGKPLTRAATVRSDTSWVARDSLFLFLTD